MRVESVRVQRKLGALLLVALVAVPVVPASPALAAADCSYKEIPGLGLACRQPNGLYELYHDRGTGRLTHGHDLASAMLDGRTSAPAATPSDPACVTSGSYLTEVIYAVPNGRASQFSTRAQRIRDLTRQVNGRIVEEAAELGASRRYRILCDGGGQIIIRHEQLTTTTATTTFQTLVTELENRGYTDGTRKYWVWFEGSAGPGILGTGHLYNDDKAGATNLNNGNGQALFAVLWGDIASAPQYESTTWMHEQAHNMGAVQSSAPRTSGNGHCIDDQDVMCYVDGGAQAACCFQSNVCTDREHFDCNHNDYFHTDPPAGSYLATKWNLGSTNNRFLDATASVTIRFDLSSVTVSEDAGTITLGVTRTGSSASAVGVSYATANGTATAGSDYTATSGTLTFGAGATAQNVTVPIVSDGPTGENDETFSVSLSAPTGGATLGSPSTNTVTITESLGSPEISFSSSTASVSEGTSSVSLTVLRTGQSSETATVQYASTDGTAQSGADYTAVSGTLTFNSGITSRTISVPLLDDNRFESNETFTVSLSSPTNATLGLIGTSTVTIIETDARPTLALTGAAAQVSEASGSITLTIARSGATGDDVGVTASTSNGSATAGQDYTATSISLSFPPGTVTRTVTVPIYNDADVESNETFTVSLSAPLGVGQIGSPASTVVTILDDDGGFATVGTTSITDSEANLITFPVVRTVPVEPASVGWRLTQTSPAGATQSGTINFPAGQTQRSVSVNLNDGVVSGDRLFSFTLIEPAVGLRIGTPSMTTLRLLDDDIPPVVSFDQPSSSVEENAGSRQVTILRSGNIYGTSSVTLSAANGTALLGQDLSVSGTGLITFDAGQSIKTVTVTVTDDGIPERAEQATLTLSAPNQAALGASSHTFEIRASDQQPDLLVRSTTSTGWTGNAQYSSSPTAQQATGVSFRAIGGDGQFMIENDGNATNQIVITAASFSDVTYRIGSTDVTALVTSPEGLTVQLDALANTIVAVQHLPSLTSTPGTVRLVTVAATWTGDGVRQDAASISFRAI